MIADKLTLGLGDSPELDEALSRKAPGEECTLKIKAAVDEIDTSGKMAVLSVREVTLSSSYSRGGGDLPDGAPVSSLMKEKG